MILQSPGQSVICYLALQKTKVYDTKYIMHILKHKRLLKPQHACHSVELIENKRQSTKRSTFAAYRQFSDASEVKGINSKPKAQRIQ